jgi:putrescine transport system substrate-binding protein
MGLRATASRDHPGLAQQSSRLNSANKGAFVLRPVITSLITLAVLTATQSASLAQTSAKAPATPAAGSTAPKEEPVLNFSNWVDYIPESMIKEFEAETGIKVNYKTYGSNEALEKQVRLKADADDLVVPGLNYGKSHAAQGYYQPLNKALLPNFKNLAPDFLKSMEPSDPGNRYFVPWAWGHTTVFVNKTRVIKALAGLPYPANELDLVFKPEYTSRLKSCGIAYMESPSEILPLTMHYMGLNPYSTNPADYKKAAEALKPVRPHIATFSTKMLDVLEADKVCAAIAWSGDIQTAIDSLKKAGNKDELRGVLPAAGNPMFVDVLAVPVNAKHPKNAHAFIDFYLRAKNSAGMPNEIGYGNGNAAAMEFVDATVKAKQLVFPPQDFFKKLVPVGGYSAEARWAMMQSYMSFAFQIDAKKQ